MPEPRAEMSLNTFHRYDISDYQDIHEQYGSVQDVEQLIAETHKRGMKM